MRCHPLQEGIEERGTPALGGHAEPDDAVALRLRCSQTRRCERRGGDEKASSVHWITLSARSQYRGRNRQAEARGLAVDDKIGLVDRSIGRSPGGAGRVWLRAGNADAPSTAAREAISRRRLTFVGPPPPFRGAARPAQPLSERVWPSLLKNSSVR